MKKKILLPFLVLFSGAPFMMSASPVKSNLQDTSTSVVSTSSSDITSSDISDITETSTEVEYPCKVVISDVSYGDILTDLTEGNVGDIVTIYAKPYVLCSIEYVKVNGVDLIADESGNYSFSLVEGENVITAVFKIDQEQVSKIATLFESAKAGNWQDIFNMENLFTVIGWTITTLLSSGFFVTLLKYKKIKTTTADNTTEIAKAAIDDNLSQAVTTFLKTTLGPTFDTISAKLSSTEEVCKVLARCFVLSQENTPESRLAIIQELTKLQTTNENLTAQVKEIINNEIKKNEELKNAKVKAIEELEAANNNIGNEKMEEVDNNDVIPTN